MCFCRKVQASNYGKTLTLTEDFSRGSTRATSDGPYDCQNTSQPTQFKMKSLETFFGIGNNSSARLMSRFNIHPTCRVGELANKQVLDLTAVLSEMKIENDLRREVLNDIKRMKETGTYRGRRHALGLPVRGQRTRTQVGFLSSLS
ncbi:unnamed protein product [Penicillium egyptiacum]|uniref:Ribosomal protein S13 n=1 Tax=Penicillium egyptiacum TaxID=1303716 RepID=A0A9W4P1P7_9EURO|nr:unnamed protein product [Penicillium egyptiacum]